MNERNWIKWGRFYINLNQATSIDRWHKDDVAHMRIRSIHPEDTIEVSARVDSKSPEAEAVRALIAKVDAWLYDRAILD